MSHNTGIPSMLIFSVCYLGIFFAFMWALPILAPNLLYGGKTYNMMYIPPTFSVEDIEQIKYYENGTLNYPVTELFFDFNPEINIKLWSDWKFPIFTPKIRLSYVVSEWNFLGYIFIATTPMYFQISSSSPKIDRLTRQDLINAWQPEFNASVFYPVATSAGQVRCKCWFTDVNTTRNNIGLAWDDGHINLGIGIGIDDIVTSYNAYNLVATLLTFSKPEIFGSSGTVAILLNSLITIPIFLCIAYLIFYFITSIIPFIRGA